MPSLRPTRGIVELGDGELLDARRRARARGPVGGMSCISPCAPTALTAPGSNVDSCWITAATSAGSTPAAPRARGQEVA